MSDRISFHVSGKAITQGSKRRFRNSMCETNNIETKTLPANRLKDWREKVGRAAASLMSMGGHPLWLGPVRLECEFNFVRPKSHLNAKGLVKAKHKDAIPTGDVDKYARAIGDSLTGVSYKDDTQVADLFAIKRYSDSDHVRIGVVFLGDGV